MSAEATVLHGPLPSAHGNTASPMSRGGDERSRSLHASREQHHHHHQQRRDSQSSYYYREQDKREGRSQRYEDRDSTRPSSSSASAASSSSWPYRDIIKSVLSVMTRSDLSALTSASAPASSDKNLDKERDSEKKEMKDKDRNVEDVVRGLAMEEWNSRWLDELVAKVKGELNDTASDHSISDNGPPTPLSDTSSKDSMKRYQPTVEDYDESEDEASSIFERSFAAATEEAQHKPLTRTSSSLSNASSDSSSSSSSYSAASSASSSPSPTDKDSVPSPPSSVSSSSPPPRPTVRFADKQPPVIHYIPEPPEPEEPEDERDHERERERERESYREPERESYREPERESYREPDRELYQPSLSSPSSSSSLHQRQGPAWPALFNERDEPTPALGRFLRGLANHIIAEYAPIDSLVITPDKLFKFYTRYRLDNEFFPFQRVFDTRYHKSLRGISFLFTDLRCEHHLVQHSIASKPCIPALTPTGFEDWMTLMIRARQNNLLLLLLLVFFAIIPPGRTKTAQELPRELFPERGHARAFDLLASSFAEWKSITSVVVVPSETTTSLPPPSSSSSSSSHSQSHLHLHHPAHTYASSSLIPPSLQKLPPAATKALKEDTRRHKDPCYIDQSRIIRPSSLIYPPPSATSSPSSSFSTNASSSSPLPAGASLEGKGAEGVIVSSAASSSSSSSSSSGSSSGGSSSSKHRSSRSKEREARHRGASERSSRPREPSPPREGRRHHKSRRYRDS
ncbi:hypothetical protein TgHK011_001493 [Trichoderma gracile]|nr:hypothetical protein TgHK011_001493 [Trichoderma gracile]